jgi:hypothetical protein
VAITFFRGKQHTHPIARERDRSQFHLDQQPNATAVVFEEPIIDQPTIRTWKLIMEGSPLPTYMKHMDKGFINRLPILISTNHDIWSWVNTNDIPPLKQRILQYLQNNPKSANP